jgi:hypothetical protein
MLDWPTILVPFSGGFAYAARSLSGGQSLSGLEQVQSQMGDRWGATFSFHLGKDERILAVRNLLTRLRGRAGTVGLPLFDFVRPPFTVVSGAAASGTAVGDIIASPPFWERWPQLAGGPYEFSHLEAVTGDVTLLADNRMSLAATGVSPVAGQFVTLADVRREILAIEHDSGPVKFRIAPPLPLASSHSDTVGNVVLARVTTAAALNANTIDVALSIGGTPQPGHRFGIGARLHEVDAVTALGAQTYRFGISPWLRQDIAAGAVVEFVAPVCEMRLASDAEGQDALRAIQLLGHGDITLRFDEAAS